ncbi:MAG: hypothetical protein MST00_01765 [Tenericutes bacterium]|nr:hypothetical protein [Mycoplasmatota bacterium]
MNKKVTLISILILLLIACSVFASVKIMNNKKSSVSTLKVIVTETYKGYALAQVIGDSDLDIVEVPVDGLNVGDELILDVKEIMEIYPPKVVLNSYEIVSDKSENTTMTTSTTTTTALENKTTTTTKKITSTTGKTIRQTTTAKISENTYKSSDDSVLETTSEMLKDKNRNVIKENFIKIVDFIFYDSDINGYYFKDLTNGAKLKVIYYATMLDNLIDKEFPSYKENLSEMYNNTKAKLVKLYLEKSSEYCKDNENVCKQAKSDFTVLKKSLNITFDFIKGLCQDGTQKLKEWYEIYSGK